MPVGKALLSRHSQGCNALQNLRCLPFLHLPATQVQAVPGQGFGRDVETCMLESEIGASTLFQSQLLGKLK